MEAIPRGSKAVPFLVMTRFTSFSLLGGHLGREVLSRIRLSPGLGLNGILGQALDGILSSVCLKGPAQCWFWVWGFGMKGLGFGM